MQHIHSVDDQCGVGRVLAAGVAELLNGLDCHGVQHLFPALKVGGGPVAIRALDSGRAVARHLDKQLLDDGCLRVVSVNQDGEPLVVGCCHGGLPVLFDILHRLVWPPRPGATA